MDVIEQINQLPIRKYIEAHPQQETWDSLKIYDANNTWHRFNGGMGPSVLDWEGFRRYGQSWDKRNGLADLVGSIASEYGFELNGFNPAIDGEKKLISAIYAEAANYFTASLSDDSFSHLMNHYGFSEPFILMHQMGYAPRAGLITHLAQAGYEVRDMLKSGLICQTVPDANGDTELYEYFRGRLMFPYWHKGSIVNFIGRETDETPTRERTKGQKYRKIAKRSDFHATTSEHIQHNVFLGEDSINGNEIYLCEGTTDALLSIQNGMAAVAPGGTGYSNDAVLRVIALSVNKDVFIAFDSDEAGQKGSAKLATTLWESGIIAQVIQLPDGDLNEFLRDGGDVGTLPKKDIIEILANGGTDNLKEIGRLISCLTKEYLREKYQDKAAKILDIPIVDVELPATILPGEIIVNDRQYRDIISDTLSAMAAHNEEHPSNPPFLSHNDLLAKVIPNSDGELTIHHYATQSFKIGLSQAAEWYEVRQTKKGEIKIHSRPPADATAGILELKSWAGVPPIRTISKIPLFDVDGILCKSYGYHRSVKSFIDCPDFEIMSLAEAKEWLFDNLLVDFPFRDEASRTHIIAQFIQPFVRQVIRGVTPAYITTAPAQGTGKSLLSDLGSVIAQGHPFQWQTAPDNNEEWRKMITAMMAGGNPFIAIDNCSRLDGDSLAGLITSHMFEGRILGTSHTVTAKNEDKSLIFNGNNVILSKDMIRRCVLIRLDADSSTPWERQVFKISDIADWAVENRASLIGACVGIIQHWIDAGRPAYSGKTKGSFEQWSKIIGGILEAASINSFMANDDDLLETSQDSGDDEWIEFTDAWWNSFQGEPVTVAELMPLATYGDDSAALYENWKNILEITIGGGNESTRKRRFANLLAGKRDGVIGEYKIQLASTETKSKKSKQYQLKRVADGLLYDVDI